MNLLNMPKKIMLIGSAAALILGLQSFSPLWARAGTKGPAEADKLHVVLLVAGNDGDIGNADMKDIAAMKLVLDTSFAVDKHRLVYHDLTGINTKTGSLYTAAEIFSYLREMKIGSNDNVLVFHSGHGYLHHRQEPARRQPNPDGGRGPLLAEGAVNEIIRAKQPRAYFILTDCCSSFAGASIIGRNVASSIQVNVATVRNLLLKPVGTVSITAAEDGTIAVATFKGPNPAKAGSAFTVAMMRLWYTQDDDFHELGTALPTVAVRNAIGKWRSAPGQGVPDHGERGCGFDTDKLFGDAIGWARQPGWKRHSASLVNPSIFGRFKIM